MINRKKKIAAKIARFILLAIFLIAAILPLFWISTMAAPFSIH